MKRKPTLDIWIVPDQSYAGGKNLQASDHRVVLAYDLDLEKAVVMAIPADRKDAFAFAKGLTAQVVKRMRLNGKLVPVLADPKPNGRVPNREKIQQIKDQERAFYTLI